MGVGSGIGKQALLWVSNQARVLECSLYQSFLVTHRKPGQIYIFKDLTA
jgi:hypothetical protein